MKFPIAPMVLILIACAMQGQTTAEREAKLSADYRAGKPLPGMPNTMRPIILKDGALLCTEDLSLKLPDGYPQAQVAGRAADCVTVKGDRSVDIVGINSYEWFWMASMYGEVKVRWSRLDKDVGWVRLESLKQGPSVSLAEKEEELKDDAEADMRAGKPLPGLPDLSKQVFLKEGANVCGIMSEFIMEKVNSLSTLPKSVSQIPPGPPPPPSCIITGGDLALGKPPSPSMYVPGKWKLSDDYVLGPPGLWWVVPPVLSQEYLDGHMYGVIKIQTRVKTNYSSNNPIVNYTKLVRISDLRN